MHRVVAVVVLRAVREDAVQEPAGAVVVIGGLEIGGVAFGMPWCSLRYSR